MNNQHESSAPNQAGMRCATARSEQTPEAIRNTALDDVIHMICRSTDLKIGADVGPELLKRIEALRP
jgi:hypothetical protein